MSVLAIKWSNRTQCSHWPEQPYECASCAAPQLAKESLFSDARIAAALNCHDRSHGGLLCSGCGYPWDAVDNHCTSPTVKALMMGSE